MAFEIYPVNPGFVAKITGLDVRSLNEDNVQEVIAAADEYAVLIFPDQFLTKDELATFGALFGPLDDVKNKKASASMGSRMNSAVVHDISNIEDTGKVARAGTSKATFNVGNTAWHTDSSFQHQPARYSILACITAVSWGGHTQFADLRAAYDALDMQTKALIADKIGVFWGMNTRQSLGIYDARATIEAYPPVRWPLVRTHAPTGRKVLWCDRKVTAIEGMSVPEGRVLADELIEHATQKERVYSHAWTRGDVVLYDNRSCLHRGRRADPNEPREMMRVQIFDDTFSLGTLPIEQVRPDVIYAEEAK